MRLIFCLLLSSILLGLNAPVAAQIAATGIPYFQQHVHYSLAATFEDDVRSPALQGHEKLVYTNNSPDTLHELYFHLYWNLFRNGSYGESAPNRDHRSDEKYGHGGIDVSNLTLVYPGASPNANLDYTIDNTILRLKLPQPLLPGDSLNFECEWHGVLPNYGIRSTWGWHDGAARNFSTAQWYPQVCVYDNHGWHPDQYIGMGEFYTDYGAFDVALTIPERFNTIVTTGWLQNPKDVLTQQEQDKLAFARSHPDSIVRIADYSNYHPMPISKNEPTRVWIFHADSVRDFAWCADEAYIWDAVYDDNVMHHALFWNNSRAFWGAEAAKIVLVTEQTNSAFAGKYAYPNMFMCETYEGGMEYPGIVYVGPYENGSLYHWPQNTMMHELGHEWYPMMMGSNETDYGYMDEGFNTFITTFVQEKYFGRWNNSYGPGLGYNDDERTSNYRGALLQQLSGNQEPSKQKADAYLSYHDYAEATYPHTSSVFFMLRYTMGEKAFADFMHLYYERWRFKHPYPDDLLNAAEDIERREGDTNRIKVRGDLRWFFNEWFEQTWKLDYSIGDFHTDGTTTTVKIERNERAVMPLDLVFTFEDGTTEQKWIPVDDWLRTVADERTYTYTFAKRPVHVEINPSRELMETNRLNNSSSWLPPMDVSLVPRIFGDEKPIDKYAIRSAPYIWPRSGDFKKWAFGWTLLGGYLDRTDRLAIGLRGIMTGAGTLPGDLIQYHSVADWLSPWTDIDISAIHAERTDYASAAISQVVTVPGTTTPRHIFSAAYDFHMLEWFHDGVVPELPTATLPPLNRGYVAYTFHDEAAINEFTFAAQAEDGLGDPRTTYTKLAGTLNDRLDLGVDWDAYVRLFGGSMQPIDGLIPQDTKFQLASSSDIDHFADMYGSNFGSSVRDKIRNAAVSGPLVRGYLDEGNDIGRVAVSGSFELNNRSLFPFTFLREIPFIGQLFEPFGLTVFADAGMVTDAFCTCELPDHLKSDIGLGLRFFGMDSRWMRTTGLDLDRVNAQIDFPLYIDKPLIGEAKLKFRVVGMVRQEF